MSLKPIFSDLPELYKKFLPSFFQSNVYEETFATCSNCAMACHDEKASESKKKKAYLPDKKCCTYFPDIPNFLIGALLSDPDPLMEEGKKRIRNQIKNRTGVTPISIDAPKIYRLIYRSGSTLGFGRSKNLLCPYFKKDNGMCTVWKYREAVCSTYFCKYTTNDVGSAFWNGLNNYLSFIQEALIKYTLVEKNIRNAKGLLDEKRLLNTNTNLSEEEIDGEPTSENRYKYIWGDWYNKEEEFYKSCYELVSALNPEKFNSIAGIEQRILLNNMEEKRNRMFELPKLLKKTDRPVLKKKENGNYSVEYVAIDTFVDIPTFIIDSFDGVNFTEDVKKMLLEKYETELDDEILTSLYRYGILEEVKSNTPK